MVAAKPVPRNGGSAGYVEQQLVLVEGLVLPGVDDEGAVVLGDDAALATAMLSPNPLRRRAGPARDSKR